MVYENTSDELEEELNKLDEDLILNGQSSVIDSVNKRQFLSQRKIFDALDDQTQDETGLPIGDSYGFEGCTNFGHNFGHNNKTSFKHLNVYLPREDHFVVYEGVDDGLSFDSYLGDEKEREDKRLVDHEMRNYGSHHANDIS